MLSPETKELSKKISDIRLRTEKAKDEVLTLARTVVLVLKTTAPAVAEELERRIFLVDAEQASLGELMKNEGNIDRLMELLTESFKDK